MFYSLNGTLIHTEPSVAVIECGGVGYKCTVSMSTQKSLPKLCEKTQLYTYLNVNREGNIELFGFISQSELNCFKKLISVSGVGPKFAIAILSELSPDEVAIAIASSDSKSLTRAAGVGNKLAQRIILELRDKLKSVSDDSFITGTACAISASKNTSEAINALGMLGYSSSEVAPIVAKLDGSLSVEELIRLSLQSIAKGM